MKTLAFVLLASTLSSATTHQPKRIPPPARECVRRLVWTAADVQPRNICTCGKVVVGLFDAYKYPKAVTKVQ